MVGSALRDFAGKRIHMVGIGGSSMSGLALMLAGDGFEVSGTDRDEGYTLLQLRKRGMDVRAGHHPGMVDGAGLLVYSAAVSSEDPERARAAQLHVPQMERAVLLGALMQGYRLPVCVCGTHGKTTTTAMLAQALTEAGLDPSVHLGGSLDAIGGSVRAGDSRVFVAEACEFNRSFLHMPVGLAVVLNIEEDHLDCYGDMEHVEEAYLEFLSRLPRDGIVVANGEDERVARVLGKLERGNRVFRTFGLQAENDYYPGGIAYDGKGCASFTVLKSGTPLCRVALKVPGVHNALHALAALAAADLAGADLNLSTSALNRFTNAHRRFEHTGSVWGMELYHDYGHNPAEMRVAVEMARLQNRRVVAVMQPHTFSRVKTLFQEYLSCTARADVTLVTDIYAAREKDPGDVHSGMLVDGMRNKGIDAVLTPGFDDVERWLRENGREGDLVLTMGCGNVNLLNDQIQRNYEQCKEKAEELSCRKSV